MNRVPVYILAGGKSRRFGSDKARADAGGRPMILRIADAVAPVAASVTAVADRPGKYGDLGLHTIADREPGLGPLAGLGAALADLGPSDDWLLLVSCDLIAVRPAWAQRLLEHVTPEAQAVAFRGERWEPLCAMYRRSISHEVEARLGRGELAMWRLLEAVDTQAVALPPDWPGEAQANDPASLARILRDRGVADG